MGEQNYLIREMKGDLLEIREAAKAALKQQLPVKAERALVRIHVKALNLEQKLEELKQRQRIR